MRLGIVLAAGLAFPASAMAMDLLAAPAIRFQTFELWHDASASSPLLGNPTSVLKYPVLVAPSLILSAKGELGDWTARSEVAITAFGGGVFRDTDFDASGTAFIDTLSWAASNGGLSGRLTLEPTIAPWSGDGWSAKPFIRGEAETQSFSNFGLVCGAVCVTPTISQSVEVIRHESYGFRGGAGISSEKRITDTDTLTFDLAMLLGTMNVDDSHLLRTDLGPNPNIAYRTTTLSLDADVTYRREVTDAMSVFGTLSGGFDKGWGNAVFAAKSASPLTYPAGFQRVRVQLSLGLAGRF